MQAPRRTVDLDGEWRFVPDTARELSAEALPEGRPIEVPGCWEAQVPEPYRIVTAWYHRSFEVPEMGPDERLLVRFGAVMDRCRVFVDGHEVGRHEGGYTPFSIDITEVARRQAEAHLAVRVVNPMNALKDYAAFDLALRLQAEELDSEVPLSETPHGKQTWYTSTSGIWQSVRLEVVPRTHIESLRVRPDPAQERAIVRWRIERAPARAGAHETFDPSDGHTPTVTDLIELVIVDPDGAEISRAEASLADGSDDGEVALAIPSPRLWDIGRPQLYRIRGRLIRDGSPVDALEDRFGMRSIEARDGKVWLNGRPIYLLGALDQDVYAETLATPPSKAYLDEQVRLAQEMGLNLLRCHIKIPDPAYLDAADEAGILVWCELPSWSRFTTAAAERGRATLRAAVELVHNHPSVVAWTVINEDWGTQLRRSARDRLWLRETADWLRTLDPTRLVVDNSACETPSAPNFHLRTDLADFHLYFAMPDSAIRCRGAYADFASRPAWLWSPHGDAEPRGDEPLVMSEFGNWGLPRIDPIDSGGRRPPWWFETGLGKNRPSGIRERFDALALDRLWADPDALAEATQWHQFEALQYQIGQLRRHPSIEGYVITEFTDAYWEANGLLDVDRRPKAFHQRLGELNAEDVVVVDLAERDLWGGGRLAADVYVSSYGEASGRDGGTVRWELSVAGEESASRVGELPLDRWPRSTVVPAGAIHLELPEVSATRDARLLLVASDGDGHERARSELRLALLPNGARRTEEPLPLVVHDPMRIFRLEERLTGLGHHVVAREDARLLVTSELLPEHVREADTGLPVLVLVRDLDALPADLSLAEPVEVHARKVPPAGAPGQRSPWDGDWMSNFNWILPDAFPRLPARAPLDFAYTRVSPDHVLVGHHPARHRGAVTAGMFVGWVQEPAALVRSFRQGAGSITLTTFRLAPEDGPVATVMLEDLIRSAAGLPAATATSPSRLAQR